MKAAVASASLAQSINEVAEASVSVCAAVPVDAAAGLSA